MGDIMTLRLKDRDKETLSFASNATGIPASKLLYPFISEAIRINLGVSILFTIDRNVPYQRSRFERFVGTLREGEERGQGHDGQPPSEMSLDATPRIVLDFFWMLREVKAAEKMEQGMGEIQFTQDMGFLTPSFYRALCMGLAETYLARGLSTAKIELDQARRILFYLMMTHFYRNNARGTSKALSAKWYSHQDLINKLVDEMASRYELRYPTKVVDAIEVREAIPVVPKKPLTRTVPAKVKPAGPPPQAK